MFTDDQGHTLNKMLEEEKEAERNLINACGARPGQLAEGAVGLAADRFALARMNSRDFITTGGLDVHDQATRDAGLLEPQPPAAPAPGDNTTAGGPPATLGEPTPEEARTIAEAEANAHGKLTPEQAAEHDRLRAEAADQAAGAPLGDGEGTGASAA